MDLIVDTSNFIYLSLAGKIGLDTLLKSGGRLIIVDSVLRELVDNPSTPYARLRIEWLHENAGKYDIKITDTETAFCERYAADPMASSEGLSKSAMYEYIIKSPAPLKVLSTDGHFDKEEMSRW